MTWTLWKGTPNVETFKVAGATWKTQTHTFDNAGNYTTLVDPEAKTHAWTIDENNLVTFLRGLLFRIYGH